MKADLYVRVSSDRQDVDLSISAQLRALRDYAARNNHVVVREFADQAESGTHVIPTAIPRDDISGETK